MTTTDQTFNPKDLIYVTHISLPEDPSVNTAFCDSKGVLSMGHVDDSSKETVRQILSFCQNEGKGCAVVCIELDDGQVVTSGVEISSGESAVLRAIVELVFNGKIVNGMIPESYVPCISKIIARAKTTLAEQGYRLKVQGPRLEPDFDPTLHIVPLDPKTNTPVVFIGKEDESGRLVGITTDGRVSYFPVESKTLSTSTDRVVRRVPLFDLIHERIAQHFPERKDIYGNRVNQFVLAGVMYGNSEEGQATFIFEVWGFKKPLKELNVFYEKLNSLGGRTVGDRHCGKIEDYFRGESVKRFINQLISFLKTELDWANYVKDAIDRVCKNHED